MLYRFKLGQLNHYKPRGLKIPSGYGSAPPPGDPPEITIVTPSLNQGAFIERTIQSVLDQNYDNLNYIIVDGGSEDNTHEILEKYKDRGISVLIEEDGGQAEAINKGFAKAGSGEIMAWLNSDDILLPGTINYIVKIFSEKPGTDVLYGHRILIDENDDETGRWILPAHDKKVLQYTDFIPQETLFWRRGIWERTGGSLDENFDFALDWDLLLRFADAGAKFYRAPRFLSCFRVHPQQKTSAVMHSVGNEEIDKLRKRTFGKSLSADDIAKACSVYLVKAELLYYLWKLGLLGY